MRTIRALLSALISIRISWAAPTNPHQDKSLLEDCFDVDFTNEDHGGCGSVYKGSIELAYSEAMQMVQHSNQRLSWLSTLRPEQNHHDTKALDKITGPFRALFGETPWSKDEGASVSLSTVQGVFQKYLEVHSKGSTTTGAVTYHLRCGDHWLKYLRPEDKDPREEGKQNAEKYTLARPRKSPAFPNGALYGDKGLPLANALVHVDHKPKDLKSPYCNNNVKAVSNKANSLLILCPKAYMAPPYKPNAFHLPKKDDIDVDMPLDDLVDKALAVTWIHEMDHYVNGWPEPKVGGEDVYFWDKTVALAKTDPKMALQAPEAFALFAAAMWYDDWDWSTGKAKARPGAGDAGDSKLEPPAEKVKGPFDPFA